MAKRRTTISLVTVDELPGGVIRWEDPPPPRRSAPQCFYNWQLVAIQLRRRSPDWGLVIEDGNTGTANAVQSRISKGKTRHFQPAGSFEAEIRTTDKGASLWARYIGPPPTDDKTSS